MHVHTHTHTYAQLHTHLHTHTLTHTHTHYYCYCYYYCYCCGYCHCCYYHCFFSNVHSSGLIQDSWRCSPLTYLGPEVVSKAVGSQHGTNIKTGSDVSHFAVTFIVEGSHITPFTKFNLWGQRSVQATVQIHSKQQLQPVPCYLQPKSKTGHSTALTQL